MGRNVSIVDAGPKAVKLPRVLCSIPMPSLAPQDRWRSLLEHAIRAPSPHNVQPWRIRIVDETRADLLIEKRRTLPNEDVTGSFIILTMGLFLEALRLVAAHHGLGLEVELAHEPAWFAADRLAAERDPVLLFARLRLSESPGAQAEYSLATLAERRTSRLPYRPEPVTPVAAQRLDAVAGSWGHRYAQSQDAGRIERVLRWNVEAVFEDLNTAPYREELAGWLRYRERSSLEHRDGLDARCMNVAPLELWLPFHWPGLLRFPVTRPWLARRYREQIGTVATMGFLSGPFWDPRDAFRTGGALLHFWLECTRLGYFIHPYGNLVTNRPVAARVEAEIGIPDVWLAFKIGRSAPPPASRRRSVEEALV